MTKEEASAALTLVEKRIAKALSNRNWSNQKIHALINLNRDVAVNFGRIADVKKNDKQEPATDEEIEFYEKQKRAYDPQTGLNRYKDERLIRARESMILAVHTFNGAGLRFKSEIFSVLSIIAWTYLLHEFYERKGENIVNKDGNSILLGQMIERGDCPLPKNVCANIKAIKMIRDKVEHVMIGKADIRWIPLYQACCLNFDKYMCELFGDNLTLSNDLSLALQFSRLNIEQASMLNQYEIPENIAAFDAKLADGLSDEQRTSHEFQFRVAYTLENSSKSKSHFQFFKPENAEGKKMHNVLAYLKPADDLWPYKPKDVVSLVCKASGVKFTSNDHTKAWKHYKVRPKGGAKNPDATIPKYCHYHKTHKDYTYSDEWIEFLVTELAKPGVIEKIKKEIL